MNFRELQAVVNYLKQFSSCPKCKRKYGERHLSVLTTVGNEAFFYLACPGCGLSGILGVAVVKEGDIKGKITLNDVLDMRNFLKNLKGDLADHLH